MDDSDPLADVMAELAAQKDALTKLHHIKETLQNEVVARGGSRKGRWCEKKTNNRRNAHNPKRNKKQDRTRFTIEQTWYPQVYQLETMFMQMKPLLMQKKNI